MSDGGWTPWTQPLTLGTNKAVYIEDNTFTVSTADAGVEDQVDAYAGARLVIRHNQFTNSTVGFHGTDSGSERSPFSFEVYSNTFTNNSSVGLRGGTMRGGTGVWYGNTYGGSHSWYGITLMSYRSCAVLASGWGGGPVCDGMNRKLISIDHTLDLGRELSTTLGSECGAPTILILPALLTLAARVAPARGISMGQELVVTHAATRSEELMTKPLPRCMPGIILGASRWELLTVAIRPVTQGWPMSSSPAATTSTGRRCRDTSLTPIPIRFRMQARTVAGYPHLRLVLPLL